MPVVRCERITAGTARNSSAVTSCRRSSPCWSSRCGARRSQHGGRCRARVLSIFDAHAHPPGGATALIGVQASARPSFIVVPVLGGRPDPARDPRCSRTTSCTTASIQLTGCERAGRTRPRRRIRAPRSTQIWRPYQEQPHGDVRFAPATSGCRPRPERGGRRKESNHAQGRAARPCAADSNDTFPDLGTRDYHCWRSLEHREALGCDGVEPLGGAITRRHRLPSSSSSRIRGRNPS